MEVNKNEAENLKKQGLYFLSALEYSLLFAYAANKDEMQYLNPKNVFNESELKSIYVSIIDEYERAERVLSFGNRWNDDEFLFVFTFLMNYRLLKDYFGYYSIPLDLKVNKIYDLLGLVTSDKENKKNALIADKIIRRNRKDFSSDWLNSVLKINQSPD